MSPDKAALYFMAPEDMSDDDLWTELDSLEQHGFTHGPRWKAVCAEMDKRGL